jgi:multidrug efflux pump subunit AcrB
VVAVLREGVIAAGLTALMIRLFLGSWRPTIVVMISPISVPVSTGTAPPGTPQPVPGELSNVATYARDSIPGSANQANIRPVYEVYASTQARDLGSVAADIDKVTTDLKKELSPGNTIQVTGQMDSMNQAFRDMTIGLLFAAVFVYLMMVVNYQNFGDPFVVILALPATFCGIVTMLYITDAGLSVPSLMEAWRSAWLRPTRSCS